MTTQSQIDLLHHTLGVRPDQREPYRNHFLASLGHHDYADLVALESDGLMKRVKPPAFCRADDIVFVVTDSGKQLAIESLPQPPKRTKWDEYLRSEYSDSFAGWLGITVPDLQYSREWGKVGWVRYVRTKRTSYGYDVVAGQYKPTKKEAKASYKEALRAHNNPKKMELSAI